MIMHLINQKQHIHGYVVRVRLSLLNSWEKRTRKDYVIGYQTIRDITHDETPF